MVFSSNRANDKSKIIPRNSYSIIQKCGLALFLIRTKLICRKARLIRFPIELRGIKYIDFGENLTTGVGCRLEAFSGDNEKKMIFKKNIQLNDYVHICAMDKVVIGDNTLIASHVYISDCSHGSYKGTIDDSSPETPPMKRKYVTQPVSIGKNCWIGEGVIIMPGVIIGDGVVIGAHSVVNKNIESNSIAVGSPARVVKKFDSILKKWCKI